MAEKGKEPWRGSAIKKLDELFAMNGGVNPLDVKEPIKPLTHRSVSIVSIDSLKPFPGHPFRLYEGERLADMVESIRANGVLVPILIRITKQGDEILSGHNRVNAAKIAGLDTVPAIALADISDAEAWIYVIETNLMQRSFSDMSHSEKAAVISTQHSKLFSQGKRTDIIKALKLLDNPLANEENETSSQVEKKLTSIEKVGVSYSLSKDTIARYLRVAHLIPALKTRLDNNDFAFIPAVSLSYLKEDEQALLDKLIEDNGFKVDMKQAALLRQHSESGKLDAVKIESVLNGQARHRPPPNRTPSVKVSKAVYSKYFKPSQSAKEVQSIVEKALEQYFSA